MHGPLNVKFVDQTQYKLLNFYLFLIIYESITSPDEKFFCGSPISLFPES